VPVYDGRLNKFEPDKSLNDLAAHLPPYEDEIPIGSLALVAYTANSYARKGSQSKLNLALNINWAVVLGTPK
jgi:hypothetical protein